MKKILLLILVVVLFALTGCKNNNKVELEDLLGKYEYVKCVYVHSQNTFTKADLNAKYKGVARYSLKESNFAFYETSDTTPSISLKLIKYQEVKVNEGITDKEVKRILKGASTRYDVFKLDQSQGYCFIFKDDVTYFLEFRQLSKEVSVVWHIFEIEKRD